MSKIATKLSIREKMGYGVGDTASHFVWDMVGFWILIFYTDTFGISAAAAGTIMLIARAWDMVNDPLMGIIADRTKTTVGQVSALHPLDGIALQHPGSTDLFHPRFRGDGEDPLCSHYLLPADDGVYSHQSSLFFTGGSDDLRFL